MSKAAGARVKMSSDEEENENEHSRSPSPDIKSKAVVKYTAVKCPTSFSKLQCNTDLKMPPSNWLSSATDSYGLRHSLVHSAGFSSFKMAHMFPDCVGEVDVVSGAECIKNLLKLPYHPTGVISMIVHRIENTLLLDDFDIFQCLMKSEWSWMKKFLYEKSISTKDGVVYLKNKSRYALEQKSLVSKFLYHSLPSSKSDTEDDKELQCPTLPLPGPSLPEPDVRRTVPYPSYSNHTYNRNVVWTFEDIQMLIGSDMPIFGGIDRPCVSLRLRDASEPINVLTGIDYWLDNLMCNVPEVIMCYHLDGIVSKYEPIKTEDLPNLKDSKFSPKVIKNVAQNILSFLKSNATKAGHTYWLFKGTHDDVVKLYDLTTLCGTVENSTDQNPFTVPVAMLLYRVARNMKIPCQSGHVKLLLENCIKLLDKEKYPHIVASSHFMLANLYVPSLNMKDNTNGECQCGDPKTCRRQEDFEDDETAQNPLYNNKKRNSEKSFDGSKFANFSERNKNKGAKSKNDNKLVSDGVDVHSLTAPSASFSSPSAPPPTISDKIEDRCLIGIVHVKEGLYALKHFICSSQQNRQDNTPKHDQSDKLSEDNPKMAKSHEPIPMGYETLQNSSECKMADPNIPIPMPYVNASETEPKTSKSERNSRRRKKESKNKKKQTESQNKLTIQEVENLKNVDGALLRKDNTVPTWQEPKSYDDSSWKVHLKTLLYEKACVIYATLAEQYYADGQYGLSYKYTMLAQTCHNLLVMLLKNLNPIEECCLLGRAGDNLFQFAKNWDKYQSIHLQQMKSLSDADKFLKKEIDEDIAIIKKTAGNLYKTIEFKPPKDLENATMTSVDYYNRALKMAPNDRKEELLRRIASVKNELGVKYMYNAQEQYLEYCNSPIADLIDEDEPQYEVLSKKSIQYLTESAKIFEQVKDMSNLALLHCNIGRYMRFRAHCNQENHSSEQRKLYASAIDHYGQALRLLLGDDFNNIKDLVRWELSSALFTQACLLQDSPPDSPDAAAEAAEALHVALRNCPLTESPRQCLYQFRAGILHHRLASLYHKQYRESPTDKSKATCALAKLHYEQAVRLFLPLEDTTIYLTVQMEHVALLEYQANNNPGLKTKSLQTALELMQQCEPVLKLIKDKDSSSNQDKTKNSVSPKKNSKDFASSMDNKIPTDDDYEEFKLLTLFEQRLQFILKTLIQVYIQKHGVTKKDAEKLLNYYKKFYGLTLKIGKFNNHQSKFYAQTLYNILINIKEYVKDNEICP